MFDEYYSVSLSFWTRTGLREKARQGHLVGALPWGYVRDPETKVAVPDSEKAPLVRELFERYAGGHETDRSLAAWLNTKGARLAKGRPFTRDTVRELLLNSAYCGFVGASGARTGRSAACMNRSSPRSCSIACRKSGRGVRVS
jgi:hypothetical protein